MIALSWEIHELEELSKQGRQLLIDGVVLVHKYDNSGSDIVSENVPRLFGVSFQVKTNFIKILYHLCL